jgi:predicted DNA-binding transcriptional regulator YafY
MDLTFEEMARRLEVTTRTIYRYANRETQPEEMIRLRLFDLASEHGKLVHVVETP